MSSLFSTLTYERPSWEGPRLEYLAPADGRRTAPQVGTGGLICPVLSSPPILNTTGTILSLEWFFWPASSSLLEEVLSSWCGLSTWAKSKSQVLSQALNNVPIRKKRGENQRGSSSFFPCIWDKASLCIPGCSWTHCSHKLKDVPASQVL